MKCMSLEYLALGFPLIGAGGAAFVRTLSRPLPHSTGSFQRTCYPKPPSPRQQLLRRHGFQGKATDETLLDVAIVGAGPAGLALAVGLKGKGIRVKVFEAAPEINERGAAVFVQSIGLVELDKLKPGLAAEAVAAGRPVDFIHLTRPSGDTIFKVDMRPLGEFFGYPFLGITRFTLQSVLKKHLGDGELQVGARLLGLSTHRADGIIELSFDGSPEVVRTRAVVGADGRSSVVRKIALAQEEKNCDWALTWWALADLSQPITLEGEFRMSFSRKQAIYYGEVENGITMWSFTCWRDGEVERNPELRAARALKELEGWPEDLRNVVRSTRPDKIIEVFVGDSPLQWQTWSKQPGVTLMGDAAHAMLPTLGMGVTSALQDAVALKGYIGEGDTPLAEALLKLEDLRRLLILREDPPPSGIKFLSRIVGRRHLMDNYFITWMSVNSDDEHDSSYR